MNVKEIAESFPKLWLITVQIMIIANVLLFAAPTLAEGETESKPANVIVREAPKVADPSADPVQIGKAQAEKIKEDFIVGKVKSVSQPTINKDLLDKTGMVTKSQFAEIELQEGAQNGTLVKVENSLGDNPSFNINLSPGKEVILSVVSEQGKDSKEYNIADYHRAPALMCLAAIFLIAYLVFGGKSGLKSLLGLVVAICLIGFVLLPLSLQGFNPLISSALICFAAAIATIFAIAGLSKKATAAFLGTMGGVIVAGIAAYLVIDAAPLTGLSSEEAQILRASMPNQPLSFFSGLLAASMLIGALGVIMDVAISIASAVQELSQTDQSLNPKQLYTKGMNVGRDIMGSMTSTLVLAYSGGALPLLLLMSSMPSMKLINLDIVASEIASALAGSLGLVLTIPLTALAASRLMGSATHVSESKSDNVFAQLDEASKMTTASSSSNASGKAEE
ncbi:MAG: YibE/F family protein [Candidatus Obscuribacterales bacterium]|jgi:uncharacterized membrane protein|nr:YibE/F family protein [Candidatus Obscuribacterales bacterium]